MTRKRKSGGGGGQNFWPGYVDALTNVVLNLLFMVAIFGIALTLFNSIPRSNGVPQMEGPGQYALAVPPQPPAAPHGESGEPAQTESAPAPRTPGGTEREGKAASEARVVLADPTHAVPGQRKDERIEPGKDKANAAPDAREVVLAAAARAASSAPRSAEAPHPEVPSQFAADQVAIVVADSYSRRGGPEPRLIKGTDSSGRLLITLEVPDSADPLALSRSSLAGALRDSIPRTADQRLVMWTVTDRDDPERLRGAYVALAAMRNQLIAAGWPTRAIDVRLQPGSTRAANGLRVFITSVSADNTP